MSTETRTAPTVAVVICAYSIDRWDDLSAAIASVRAQDPLPTELIIVIDHNDDLHQRAAAAWPELVVVASTAKRGLSGARNTGVARASADIVAFLDDDARAEPSWLAELLSPYPDRRVVATGGFAEASWDAGRPRWFPTEFDWVVGCSYTGLPTQQAIVRNPIGCNMSFRRQTVLDAGGFRSDIGRVGRFPVGGEETELCIRIGRVLPDASIVFVPSARVRHRVTRERTTWRYFRARCYQEGRSKALISSMAGPRAALAAEARYTRAVLPAGFVRGLARAVRGDPAGLLQSLVIVAGLALTTAGYVAGRTGLDRLPMPSGGDHRGAPRK